MFLNLIIQIDLPPILSPVLVDYLHDLIDLNGSLQIPTILIIRARFHLTDHFRTPLTLNHLNYLFLLVIHYAKIIILAELLDFRSINYHRLIMLLHHLISLDLHLEHTLHPLLQHPPLNSLATTASIAVIPPRYTHSRVSQSANSAWTWTCNTPYCDSTRRT